MDLIQGRAFARPFAFAALLTATAALVASAWSRSSLVRPRRPLKPRLAESPSELC